MTTQIIYDETGFIIRQMQGSDLREPVGIPYMVIEIPDGKYLVSIDITGEVDVPVYENFPATQQQLLEERLQASEDAILFLMDTTL